MALQIRAAKLPAPEREQRLIPGRQFRCDFVWRDQRLVLEVDGGTWAGGRHTRGSGFQRDCEKTNLLTLEGYRGLRVTEGQVRKGHALEWLRLALAPGGPPRSVDCT